MSRVQFVRFQFDSEVYNLKNRLIMPENIKVYKFLFRAHITTFDLKANISSPLIVTWKRSNETASTDPVQMISGKADIHQTLTLPVNMYFDLDEQKFQQKKSIFSFTMKAPKGDKQAGVIYVNLANQVNEKKQIIDSNFTLQKCPVKNSEVHISITAQCIGQKDEDGMSQSSFVMQKSTHSTLSIESNNTEEKRSKIKQLANTPEVNKENLNTPAKPIQMTATQIQQKDRKIKELESIIQSLRDDNKKLKNELATQKDINKKLSSGSQGSLINSLKEQLLKGKSIQDKLESDIESYRQENLQHERELEAIRLKMDKIYQTFCKQFDIQQL